MKIRTSKSKRVAARRERSKLVKEAVAEAKADEARRPEPIESNLLDGETVEVVGSADAPTSSQVFRFQGHAGTALPPYVAPPESPHAGQVMRPVKIHGKVVGIPESRLRPVDRPGVNRARAGSTSAFRRGFDRIFGRGRSST
jgi:hypothetical protein